MITSIPKTFLHKNMEFCKNTKILIGTRVKVVKNLGNKCEPFVGMFGTATHPFKYGCCQEGWIGVILDEENIYRKKLNFHIEELYVIDNQ